MCKGISSFSIKIQWADLEYSQNIYYPLQEKSKKLKEKHTKYTHNNKSKRLQVFPKCFWFSICIARSLRLSSTYCNHLYTKILQFK